MALTPERFEQGLTYAAYKEQMTRNRERLEQNEQNLELNSDDVAFFRNLPEALNVLVLAEDWCGDVLNNLPVLAGLAAASGKLNVRVFLRDQNLDIMDQYLKEGKHRSIPVFAFLDSDFRDLGHWIERPASVSKQQAEMRAQLFASEPEFDGLAPDTEFGALPEAARTRLMQATAVFRAENSVFADSEVSRELRALVGRALGQATAARAASSVADLKRRAAQQRAPRQVRVAITYCAVCGYEPQTLALTSALMTEFIYDLTAIELIPWQDGAFDVRVDGDLIHSMSRDGGFPEHATIIDAVRERLAVPVA